jgi:hypothetical protein
MHRNPVRSGPGDASAAYSHSSIHNPDSSVSPLFAPGAEIPDTALLP